MKSNKAAIDETVMDSKADRNPLHFDDTNAVIVYFGLGGGIPQSTRDRRKVRVILHFSTTQSGF